MTEVVDVTVRAQTANDGGPGWCVHRLSLGTDRHLAVVADAHGGALAPDKGPPRAGGLGAQDGAFFIQGLLPCGVGRHPQFAVDFMLVGVGQELVE
jgi:hypothetical protein